MLLFLRNNKNYISMQNSALRITYSSKRNNTKNVNYKENKLGFSLSTCICLCTCVKWKANEILALPQKKRKPKKEAWCTKDK